MPCSQLVKCNCTEKDGKFKCGDRCGCKKTEQRWTELWKCKGQCKYSKSSEIPAINNEVEETEEPEDNDDESDSEEEETYELEEYVDECEDEVLEFDIIDD